MDVLNFNFRNQSYCIELAAVSRVLSSAAVFPLPGAPAAFDGLFQLRGKIINLLNFPQCFGDNSVPHESSIVVLAKPMEQLAIRIPGPLDAKSLQFNMTHFPDDAGGVMQIVGGTVSDGKEIHHLLSLERLLAYVSQMVHATRERS